MQTQDDLLESTAELLSRLELSRKLLGICISMEAGLLKTTSRELRELDLLLTKHLDKFGCAEITPS